MLNRSGVGFLDQGRSALLGRGVSFRGVTGEDLVASFVEDADPQIAGRAAFILGTMDSWDDLGVIGRWRFLLGAF